MPELYKFQKQAVSDLVLGKKIALLATGCLAKHTPIPLANGQIKEVHELDTGDRLISYDEKKEKWVENEVDCVIRTSHNPKPMIEFEYDGEQICTTYDHPFFNGDGYYPLYQLIWGALETSQRVQLKLLCKQYGQDFNDKAIWCKHCGSNEASEGQEWLLQDYNEWKNSKGTSDSCRELADEPRKIAMCEPFRRRQDEQQGRKPGMVFDKVQRLVWIQPRRYTKANIYEQQEKSFSCAERRDTKVLQRKDGGAFKPRKIQALQEASVGVPEPVLCDDLQVCPWKIRIKGSEPYYSVCMRKAPYTYCIGGEHYFVTHNSGKTAVMFNWLRRTGKKHIVVVTTPSKVKSGDMQKEAVTWCGQEWVNSLEEFTIISWYKLSKYSRQLPYDLSDYAFAYDEIAKVKGYMTGMGQAFRRICNQCKVWTGYTATPGDQWKDFVAYLTATHLVKNKTEFQNKFCIIQTFKGYPEIIGYRDTDVLQAMWDSISTRPDTAQMFKEMPPENHEVIEFEKPKFYDTAVKKRVTEDDEFIDTTMGLCHYLRQLCFTKEKQEWLSDFIEGLGTNCLFFCNYIEEEEKVCEIAEKVLPKGAKIWRIDGSHHEIPRADTIGKYDIVVAHYLSGGEALNLQFMNYWCSISPNYSLSASIQARGRIKRLGQTRSMFFYYLKTTNTIEEDIYDCLKNKKDFSEKVWAANKGIDIDAQK